MKTWSDRLISYRHTEFLTVVGGAGRFSNVGMLKNIGFRGMSQYRGYVPKKMAVRQI